MSFVVHMIPKPNKEQGLIIGWPSSQPEQEELQQVRNSVGHDAASLTFAIQIYESIKEKL